MINFDGLSVKTLEEKGAVGKYLIAPLPKGYGNTLANSLRRILLSSLEGSAVTSIKINGVKHEYSTIPGVREDVLEILLNIKALRFKSTSDEPQVCYIEASGEKLVKGADIKVTQSVEVMNKDAIIANLTDKSSSLSIELIVERGMGYTLGDDKQRSEIGRIPLDSDFTPVRKVLFKVGKARKGRETELDSVTIEIETDGSIDPKDALMESVKILQNFSGAVMVALGMSKLEVEERAATIAEASAVENVEAGEPVKADSES